MRDIEFNYSKYNILIKKNVLINLRRYIQYKDYQNESGGMLIGSILNTGNSLEVNDLTEPINSDKSSRVNFHRSKEHNKILQDKWREGNFTKMYLGEWHTHPEKDPYFSAQDSKNWLNLNKKARTDSPLLIFLIVGEEIIRFWIIERQHKQIIRLGEISIDR